MNNRKFLCTMRGVLPKKLQTVVMKCFQLSFALIFQHIFPRMKFYYLRIGLMNCTWVDAPTYHLMTFHLSSYFTPITLLHQVSKIDIQYARTAKKMDVKRLKNHMWGFLTKPEADKVGNLFRLKGNFTLIPYLICFHKSMK